MRKKATVRGVEGHALQTDYLRTDPFVVEDEEDDTLRPPEYNAQFRDETRGNEMVQFVMDMEKSLNKTSGEHENGSTGTDQEQYWVVSVRVRYYDALLFDEFY